MKKFDLDEFFSMLVASMEDMAEDTPEYAYTPYDPEAHTDAIQNDVDDAENRDNGTPEHDMNSAELLAYMGINGRKWTEEFGKSFLNYIMNYPSATDDDIDGFVLGWFTNAIMAGMDHATKMESPHTEYADGADYVYVDYYSKVTNLITFETREVIEHTLRFSTIESAKSFIALNENNTDKNFNVGYYKIYSLEEDHTPTYKKVYWE